LFRAVLPELSCSGRFCGLGIVKRQEWALCDFSPFGKVLCVFYCVIGIALFGTFVGFIADSFNEVLVKRGERAARSR
jgi:hypothetical protein